MPPCHDARAGEVLKPDDCPESAPAMLDRSTAERLALIRYLFSIAEQQARLPEAIRSIAVLTIHDVVELFLQLVAQRVNVPLRRGQHLDFGEYFTKITEANSSLVLTRQQQMRELNTARVGFKHSWNRPSGGDIETHRYQVEKFLAENTPMVFGVLLQSVSLVALIRFPTAQSYLRTAETALASGKTGEAMIAVARGFQSMTDEYEQEARTAHGRSPFAFAENFQFDTSFIRRRTLGPFATSLASREQAEFEDKIVRSIQWLAAGMKVLSLGLDYRRYSRFQRLTPPTHLLKDSDERGPRLHLGEEDGWPPSEEDCLFCLEFAIESALQLQEVVFSQPSWRLGMNA